MKILSGSTTAVVNYCSSGSKLTADVLLSCKEIDVGLLPTGVRTEEIANMH